MEARFKNTMEARLSTPPTPQGGEKRWSSVVADSSLLLPECAPFVVQGFQGSSHNVYFTTWGEQMNDIVKYALCDAPSFTPHYAQPPQPPKGARSSSRTPPSRKKKNQPDAVRVLPLLFFFLKSPPTPPRGKKGREFLKAPLPPSGGGSSWLWDRVRSATPHSRYRHSSKEGD